MSTRICISQRRSCSDGRPSDDAHEEDFDESVVPFNTEDDAEGATAMCVDDARNEPHPDSDAGKFFLFEKPRALGIPAPSKQRLGSNYDMLVLRWKAPSRCLDGFSHLGWLLHCSGFAPGGSRRRRR